MVLMCLGKGSIMSINANEYQRLGIKESLGQTHVGEESRVNKQALV